MRAGGASISCRTYSSGYAGGGLCARFFFRQTKPPTRPITRSAPSATPTPIPACAPVLRPLLEEGDEVAEALALALEGTIVVGAAAEENMDEEGVLVEDVAAAEDEDVTPIVAASTKVLPAEQHPFSASSPQHHDPSGHKLSRALFARPPCIKSVTAYTSSWRVTHQCLPGSCALI